MNDNKPANLPSPPDLDQLVQHLSGLTNLPANRAIRIVEEVVACMTETVEEYVLRRHAELQLQGMKNPEIFERLADEVGQRVFAAPALTERQIRRMIYG